jgi:two-component system KDP operon response regulator KdpE
MKVLVAAADPQISRALRTSLEADNYKVLLAADGEKVLDLCALHSPQVVICDLVLPLLTGLEVCTHIREWSNVPFIMISDSERERDKITALDQGADDYVVKPFGMGEMLARVRAILRRANDAVEKENSVFSSATLHIDFAKRQVFSNDQEVHLTPKEYDLLRYMVKNADKVLTNKSLLSNFWGGELADENHTLRVHIANLRKKIESDPENPQFIITEVRVGYRFRSELNVKNCSNRKLKKI